jgi:Flp pilus assembly protein TadD
MTLRCPVPRCGAANETGSEACTECGSPLQSYARLSAYPAQLFNQGLAAVRANRIGEARDLFAAVVHWCPLDWEARNALALASFTLRDTEAARHHWQAVLAQRANDPFATHGLTQLDIEE